MKIVKYDPKIAAFRKELAQKINASLENLSLTYQRFAGRNWEKLGFNTPSTLISYLSSWIKGRRDCYKTGYGKGVRFTPLEKQRLSQLCKLLDIEFNPQKL